MAGSVNKVILIGNLGRDPEVRTFQDGGKVCNLRVATSETWKDRNTGERRERTEWHTVAIFNEGLVRLAEQYLRKGSKVILKASWKPGSGRTNRVRIAIQHRSRPAPLCGNDLPRQPRWPRRRRRRQLRRWPRRRLWR